MNRLVDIIGAAIVLILFAPIIAIVALLTRVTVGSPVFYRQVRPGRYGVPFTLYKVRTMRPPTSDEIADGAWKSDDLRVTRLGRILRKTSLDELPQLFNVLRGDMSLVGPRPLLMEYLAAYTPEQARRHEVRPGITGWAQVHGRNSLPWKERLALDVWYVDHRSLALDIEIIGLTVLRLVRPSGINFAAGEKPFDQQALAAPTAGKEAA